MKLKTNLILSLVLALFVTTYFIVDRTKKPKAPELPPLTDLNGKPFDANTLKGKVYILSYFQTWCSDCVKEQPQLLKLQEKFGKDKLEILMVSDEPALLIDTFRQLFKSPLDFYHTSVHLKGPQVGVKGFPTTYLINKKGRIEVLKVEGINWYTDEIVELIGNLIE